MSCEHVRDPDLQEHYESNPHLTCARCWLAGVRPVWSDPNAQHLLAEATADIAAAYRAHPDSAVLEDPVLAHLEETVCRLYRARNVAYFVQAVEAYRIYVLQQLGSPAPAVEPPAKQLGLGLERQAGPEGGR